MTIAPSKRKVRGAGFPITEVFWARCALIHYWLRRSSAALGRLYGDSGGPTRIVPDVIHFLCEVAQTPQNLLRATRADPASALCRDGVADPRPPRARRVALLPPGNLARLVRPCLLSASGPHRHRRTPAAEPIPIRGRLNALSRLAARKRGRGYRTAPHDPGHPDIPPRRRLA